MSSNVFRNQTIILKGVLFMSGIIERKKMHPNNMMCAGWSPALGMYIMNTLESASFFSYCDFYEITEDTYEHFLDEGFDPQPVRLLFSGSPHRKPTDEEQRLHDIFTGHTEG